jgi:hypothetical protein
VIKAQDKGRKTFKSLDYQRNYRHGISKGFQKYDDCIQDSNDTEAVLSTFNEYKVFLALQLTMNILGACFTQTKKTLSP